MAKNWIEKAIKNPGALHKELGVKADKKIPAGKLKAAAKKGGKEGQRARLAQTLKKNALIYCCDMIKSCGILVSPVFV